MFGVEWATECDPARVLDILIDLGADLEEAVESYGGNRRNFESEETACVAYVTEGEE